MGQDTLAKHRPRDGKVFGAGCAIPAEKVGSLRALVVLEQLYNRVAILFVHFPNWLVGQARHIVEYQRPPNERAERLEIQTLNPDGSVRLRLASRDEEVG
jgi:hypothetical protein